MSEQPKRGVRTSLVVLLLTSLMVMSFAETAADADLFDAPAAVAIDAVQGSP